MGQLIKKVGFTRSSESVANLAAVKIKMEGLSGRTVELHKEQKEVIMDMMKKSNWEEKKKAMIKYRDEAYAAADAAEKAKGEARALDPSARTRRRFSRRATVFERRCRRCSRPPVQRHWASG